MKKDEIKILLPKELKENFREVCTKQGYTMTEKLKELIRSTVNNQ